MRLGRQAQVRNRITLETVGAALQDHELRGELLQMRHDIRPHGREHAVVRARRQRHVELQAARGALAGFLRHARARIEVAAILVQVGEYHRRVILERIEHAVAVVRVDVDVGDALEARALQQLDRHAAVVEHAETGRAVARGVMQARDRHEGTPAFAVHDRLHRTQGGADHARGRLVDTSERGCVAGIEKTGAAGGAFAHQLQILRRVKGTQLDVRGSAGLEHAHAPIEPARAELADEGRETVRAERVPLAKAVTGEALADHNRHARRGARAAAWGRCHGGQA